MASHFRLAEVLEEKAVSQSELARLSGVSFPRINKICNGHAKAVSLSTLDKIAGALGVSIHDLIVEGRPPKALRGSQKTR